MERFLTVPPAQEPFPVLSGNFSCSMFVIPFSMTVFRQTSEYTSLPLAFSRFRHMIILYHYLRKGGNIHESCPESAGRVSLLSHLVR